MIRNGDVPKLRVYLMKLYMQASHRQYEANKELDAIARDPDNPEHQRKIEAAIRQQNVEENLEAAYENMPEAFGRICMLYVNVHINGNPINDNYESTNGRTHGYPSVDGYKTRWYVLSLFQFLFENMYDCHHLTFLHSFIVWLSAHSLSSVRNGQGCGNIQDSRTCTYCPNEVWQYVHAHIHHDIGKQPSFIT